MSLTHQQVSFIKSAIRILGYTLIFPLSVSVALVLIVSEVVGIVEEVGH